MFLQRQANRDARAQRRRSQELLDQQLSQDAAQSRSVDDVIDASQRRRQ